MQPTAKVPVLRYAALLVLLLTSGAYQTRAAIDALDGLWSVRPRSPFSLGRFEPMVTDVKDEAEHAGLHRGDMVVTIDGQPVSGWGVLARAVAARRPGDVLSLRLRRGGESSEESLGIPLVAQRTTQPPAREWLSTTLLSVGMPLLCLLTGFWVAAMRPRDGRAWVFLAMMLSFGFFAESSAEQWGMPWRVLGLVYEHVIFVGWSAWMFLFGLLFPERFEFEKRHAWLRWLLLVPLAVIGGVRQVLLELGACENYRLARGADRLVGHGWTIVLLLCIYLGISLFFVSLGIKLGRTQAPDAKRRLRILMIGTTLGLTPLGLLELGSLVFAGHDNFSLLPAWLTLPVLLMVPLFPLTMAYVIVVQQAMDARLVLRQGVQYALARSGAGVLVWIVAVTVIVGSAWFAADPTWNRPAKMRTIALAVGAVLLLQRFAGRLAVWIDRRFFREAYDAERLLSELADEVRTIVEEGPLLRRVAERLQTTLHVPHVSLLLQADGVFRPAFALGYGGTPDVALPASATIVARLREEKRPLRPTDVPPEERAALDALRAELLIPLASHDRLSGLMSLGAKRSDAPYSSNDLRLLHSVATQTGLALENSRLAAAMANEVARRERDRRELEIAREVQEQLFPQRRPVVAGLDYAGFCRPARQVGGDYYDFLPLADGCFGIAIGDISGKGIPAALLMASLQASLRSQTLELKSDLATLMANLNRLIHEASPPNRYATFFYGQIDPRTRLLTYANAGHNAPMVFRAGAVLRLETGGPVLGLLPEAGYAQARLALQPGDVLVAFTDGVSEALDPEDQEWGEAGLAAAVEAAGARSAQELVARILSAAEAFVSGAPQHDDMTLVVIVVG
jgi:sigma-B regulation protein RsbU (phosphoserine phosphatase)